MAEGDVGGSGAIQAAQQQQTLKADAEQAALQQKEAAAQEVAASQAQVAEQAPPAKKLSIMGYEVLQQGQTPTPGVIYGMGEYSSQVYRVNQAGSTEIWKETQYNPNASAPVAPGPSGLYLSYVGGKTPVVSAIYTPGAQAYTGDVGKTSSVYLPGEVGLFAGYSSPGSGTISTPGALTTPVTPTMQNYALQQQPQGGYYGMENTPIIGGRIAYAQPIGPQQPGMAGTPVSGAPGVYFTGDVARANTLPTDAKFDAGGGIKTPYTSSMEVRPAVQSGFDIFAAPVAVGATIYAGTEALKGLGESWASGVQKTAESGADAFSAATGGVGARQANVVSSYGSSIIGGLPATAASLPFAAAWSVTHPLEVPGKAVEIGTSMADEIIFKSEERRPGSGAGAFAGMLAGGKIAGPVAGKAFEVTNRYSPVVADVARIPTATGEGSNIVATVSTRSPLSVEPPTPRAYALFGSEVEGVKVGTGSPVPAAVEQGISVQSPALFNVRDTSITATPGQVRFLDPFFREVSKGTTEEPIVNAMFDLKQALPRSEAAIDYAKVQAQPIGSAKQVGISPETKAAVFESLAETAPETRYVGSQALAETIGEKYVRPVLESDIDLSMKSTSFDPSFQALKEIYAQEPTSTVTGGQSARGYSFKTSALEGEHTLGVVGETTDVRTYNARTAEGSIIKTQNPEYAIESKASRTLGPDIGIGGKSQAPSRLTYTPDEGTSFELGGKKPASDLADIYAASRGIARFSYQEKQYNLGAKYEGISENIKTYAEATGNAEKIALIPEDALAGVQKAPIRPGQILGVNLDIFPAAEAVEYPLYKAPKSPTLPFTQATSTSTTPSAKASEQALESTTKIKPKEEVYPETKVKEPNPNSFTGKYKEDYVTTTEPVRGPNQNTFTGWTPEDYAKTTKAEPTSYPAATEPVVASRMMASSSYAESAPAATSSYALASPSAPASYPAAYAPSSSAAAMYPGVAVPYGGSYPVAGAPQAATYPVGYPRGGDTAYPTSYPTNTPTISPSGYPTSTSKVGGRPYGLSIPQKLVALPFEEKEEHKTKRLKSKGKRFGEVFSFDVDKNFKTPGRLTQKSSPKRFTETFGMDTKNTFNKSTFGKLSSPFESINISKKKRSK